MFKLTKSLQMKHLNHYASVLTRYALVCLTSLSFSPLALHPVMTGSQVIQPKTVIHAPTASVIYVDKTASGSNDGSSWDNAFLSLQDGLDAAGADDQIWVAQGIYTPTLETNPGDARSVRFTLVDGVEIYGGFNGTESLLDERDFEKYETILSADLDGNDNGPSNRSENSYHVVSSGAGISEDTILDGFTIRDGNADGSLEADKRGGAIYCQSGSPWFANLLITANTALDQGGGLYNQDADPVLFSAQFYANGSLNGSGGAIYNKNSDPFLYSVAFFGNYALYGGAIYNETSSPRLTSNLFSGNSALYGYGGGIYNGASSNMVLINATFSANTSTNGGGLYNAGGNPQVKNSIFWGNTTAQIVSTSTSFVVQQSLVQGGCPSNVICTPLFYTTDPFFIDPDGPDNIAGTPDDNLHLKFTSPAIDAGNNDIVPGDDKDLDGDSNTSEKTPYDLDLRPRFVEIAFVPDFGTGTPPIVDMGAIEARVVYVKPVLSGANNGTSWTDAYSTLAVALDHSFTGDELWVAQGIYTPTLLTDPSDPRTATFLIKPGLSLYGGFAGNEVIRSQRNPVSRQAVLSGDLIGNDQGFTNNLENSYHVVTMIDIVTHTVTLDGFTIRSGNTLTQTTSALSRNIRIDGFAPSHTVSTEPPRASGGGMVLMNSSPVLSNLSFLYNQAKQGGGIYMREAKPLMTNCIWVGNQAEFGGGMYHFFASPQIMNGLFNGNEAIVSGGGIFNLSSSPTIINSTFSHNEATYLPNNDGDAILNTNQSGEIISHPILKNTILWDNSTFPITMNGESLITLEYSLAQYGCPTTGATCSNLLSSDPLFVNPNGLDQTPGTLDDDLRLIYNSPAVDSGSNDAVPNDLFDLNANDNTVEKLPYDLLYYARFQGVTTPFIVDRGPYETTPIKIYLPVVIR